MDVTELSARMFTTGEYGAMPASWNDIDEAKLGFWGGGDVLRVKAGGNANDTALGSGAQSVRFTGVSDTTGLLVTEEVATAGASASAWTTNIFRGMVNIEVSAAGASGNNEGVLTIEDGSADAFQMPATKSRAYFAQFSTPTDSYAVITAMSGASGAGSGSVASMRTVSTNRTTGVTYIGTPFISNGGNSPAVFPSGIFVPPNCSFGLQAFGNGSTAYAWISWSLISSV